MHLNFIKAAAAAILLVGAGAAWSTTEIERDLDGNASVFQTSPSYPETAKKR